MRRHVANITDSRYDLLVVGGGVLGACVAWDAALRGLSVLLVERADFGSGASSNSLRILHGGLRYLQRLDLRTMRESVRERSTWLRLAPHLTEPLPVLVPDYGGARENRWLLRAALFANDVLSADRNRQLRSERAVPPGKFLSASDCLERIPTLPTKGLRGGVLLHDAQMYNAERLVLEIVRAAAEFGAVVLNYVGMVGARVERDGLLVDLHDSLSGERLQARCRFMTNTSGAWLPTTVAALGGGVTPPGYAAALNLVVAGGPHRTAYTVSSDSDGLPSRRLFIVPWRGRTLIGTAHYHLPGDAGPGFDPQTLAMRFLAEVNRALPGEPIEPESILKVNAGLLPVRSTAIDPATALIRSALVLEHAAPIISVASVKYTGARAVAEDVVDRVFRRLGWSPPACRTARTLLPGAPEIPISAMVEQACERFGEAHDPQVLDHLVRSYGKDHDKVLALADADPALARRASPDSPVLLAQLEYGARNELASRVDDLLARRTELDAVGAVTPFAEEMARASLERYAGRAS
jgi:glycerol-3-phosphate dehydrogenase